MRIWTLIILSRKGKATSVQQNNNNMESISGKYLQRKKLNIHHTRFTKNTGNISYTCMSIMYNKKLFFMYLHAVSVVLQWFVFVYLHMGTVLAEQWSQEKYQL